jgi:hypothetical protein
MGHSAQFGSTQAAVPYRSQTRPVSHAAVASAKHPLLPVRHPLISVLLVVRHAGAAPLVVQLFVQHAAAPEAPPHAPFVHGADEA